MYEDGEFTGDTVPLPGNDFHFHMNEWFDKEELENVAFEEGDYIALYRCEDLVDAMVSGNRWYQLTPILDGLLQYAFAYIFEFYEGQLGGPGGYAYYTFVDHLGRFGCHFVRHYQKILFKRARLQY